MAFIRNSIFASRRVEYAIVTVCQTSRPPRYGHVAEQWAAPSVVWSGAVLRCEWGVCMQMIYGYAWVEKYHLLWCEWADCGQLQVNRDSIRQIVKVLHTCNIHMGILFHHVITFNYLNKDESNKNKYIVVFDQFKIDRYTRERMTGWWRKIFWILT